ncbi:MAG: hypothetical protein FP826_14310 [Sphingomonadales bacterium]|nr:hypothetical protein [Sphingomonadales bacterium]MBU3993570.1 hypothetical protein [Alphaproteobacteria bacterium]
MTAIPLTLGPLQAKGYTILRSGVRWLREDGQMCRANEPIGYFNVTLEPTDTRAGSQPLFADEMELQVAFAARMSGRLKLDEAMARGGYLNVRTIDAWEPGTRIGAIETEEEPDADEPGQLRLLKLAGRRMTALADVHSGLLPGWHSRTRGWWCDEGEAPLTLLSLGVCDAAGLVLGAQCAFMEMFEAARQGMQIVYVPDHPIAPCAPILLDQLSRTPAQFEAIVEDVHRHFGGPGKHLAADDWMFIGTMLSVLGKAPLKDRYNLFSATGLQQTGPADAVLLSLAVEPLSILRHRTLGYHMHVMRHHQAAAGPAVRAWLSSAFEPVKRPTDAIRQDYENLIDTLQRQSGSRLMILNTMSTSGHEDISCYLGFDAPLSATLSNVSAKELNLMLDDIAATREIDIIDVDAIAAEMGGAQHLPDGIHQSGMMQVVLRQEILHFMSDLRASRSLAVT